MELFSPAQCLGYVSFVLGVSAFLQKSDRRLKIFSGSQCLVYAVHFGMLGNFPASASLLISSGRSFLALKKRAAWVPGVIVAINLLAGVVLARSGARWLPVISSCAATVAIFSMRGIPLRLVLLFCTFCWLVNNILSGSIGGTMLEVVLAVVNVSTIIRMIVPSQPVLTTDLES